MTQAIKKEIYDDWSIKKILTEDGNISVWIDLSVFELLTFIDQANSQ